MKKGVIVLLSLVFFIFDATAQFGIFQQGEIGITVGSANYFGDLNPTASLSHPKIALGVYVLKEYNEYLGLSLSAHYAQLGYSDKYSDNLFQQERNLSFNTNIWELALQGHFNFFKFVPGDPNHSFTPFISFGIGMFTYNPYAYLNGKKYFLRPLGTEGQYSDYTGPDGKLRTPYGTLAACFPIGFGVKYNLSTGVNLTFQIVERLTTTDYIDDVSTTYAGIANPVTGKLNFPPLPNGDPSIANQLQDRSYEINPAHHLGDVPGKRKEAGVAKMTNIFLLSLVSPLTLEIIFVLLLIKSGQTSILIRFLTNYLNIIVQGKSLLQSNFITFAPKVRPSSLTNDFKDYMDLKDSIDKKSLPSHIAIIMDGNGRWAKEKGQDRLFGHLHGVESVRDIVEGCAELGIKCLTLYAFSTENWDRPAYEVAGLMELLIDTIRKEVPTLNKNNIRLHVIGDLEILPPSARQELKEALEETSNNTGLNLIMALSYSSRWEMTAAVKQIAADVKNGTLLPADISQETLQQYLSTSAFPDPELMIRTSGEYRISNFLLYQLAYAELYFTDVLWPDFRKNNLYEAIIDFQNRERRFGKTGDQIKEQATTNH